MPKTVKVKTPKPTPAPKKTEVTSKAPVVKPKVPRKSPVIKSNNNHLRPLAVEDEETLEELKTLRHRKDNENCVDVTFNGIFKRQNNFGGFEFTISNEEVERIGTLTESLDWDPSTGGSCVQHDDFTGHGFIKGKLSKDYKDSFIDSGTEIAIPNKGDMVHIEGKLIVTTMKDKGGNPKEYCYLQINDMLRFTEDGN